MGFCCQFFMRRVGAKASIAPDFETVEVSGKEKTFFIIHCQILSGNEWTVKKRFSEVKLCPHHHHHQPHTLRRPIATEHCNRNAILFIEYHTCQGEFLHFQSKVQTKMVFILQQFVRQFKDLREQIISYEDGVTAKQLERWPVQFPKDTTFEASAKDNRARILKLQLWCVQPTLDPAVGLRRPNCVGLHGLHFTIIWT